MGPPTEGFREAESLYRRALAEPGLAKREKAHILCELAWMAAAGWDPKAGARYAEDALILAAPLLRDIPDGEPIEGPAHRGHHS